MTVGGLYTAVVDVLETVNVTVPEKAQEFIDIVVDNIRFVGDGVNGCAHTQKCVGVLGCNLAVTIVVAEVCKAVMRAVNNCADSVVFSLNNRGTCAAAADNAPNNMQEMRFIDIRSVSYLRQ